MVDEHAEIELQDADFHEHGAVEVEEFGDPVPEHHGGDFGEGDGPEVAAETVVGEEFLDDDERDGGGPGECDEEIVEAEEFEAARGAGCEAEDEEERGEGEEDRSSDVHEVRVVFGGCVAVDFRDSLGHCEG